MSQRRDAGTIRRLLDRAQPGTRDAVRAHCVRGEHIRRMIVSRWPTVRLPAQWQYKHVRWVLETGTADLSSSTRYHYYRTARVIAAALGRWNGWAWRLEAGPWARPDGTERTPTRTGRPAKLSHRHRSGSVRRTGFYPVKADTSKSDVDLPRYRRHFRPII